MDWADDVAYSVHDLEDGVHAGTSRFAALADADERAAVCELAADAYSRRAAPTTSARCWTSAGAADCWRDLTGYDGTRAPRCALKRATSELTGRFCRAAEARPAQRPAPRRCARYAADLVVPRGSRPSARCSRPSPRAT